jgi:hypothetical protein
MKRNDIILFTACLFLVGVAVFFFVLATACTKTTTVQANTTDAKLADGATASLPDVCKHLVSVGCGHDTTACMAGLAGEVDSGLVLVDLSCAIQAPDAVTAAGCKGIGACPP